MKYKVTLKLNIRSFTTASFSNKKDATKYINKHKKSNDVVNIWLNAELVK